MTQLISHPSGPLSGAVQVPGDKSISHRALMIAGVAVGESRIEGLLEAADVLATADAMRALGATVERDATVERGGVWRVQGRGVGGLVEPGAVLDMGNSGTAARLLMGLLAAHPFTSFLAGDASLSARPMERVMAPLERMGAGFVARSGGRLPITVVGAEAPVPISYEVPMASAQVKSAVLLAGLNAPGMTRVVEPRATRDHTESMLRHFGVEVAVESGAGGGRKITLTGEPEITGRDVDVPGDISSAAFPLVAALLVPGSRVTLRGVGVNPLRTGLLETLREMGADIALDNRRDAGGEPVADVTASASVLKGVDVPAERAPSMIDEYPVLAVAAALAAGTTRMRGIAELRVKESDRLSAVARGLRACGVDVEEGADSLSVYGRGEAPAGGAEVAVQLDHRIAMAFLVLGAAARQAVRVDDGAPIATSFPGFRDMMNGLGAGVEEAGA
ncbi:MAG: 3-phosphoshikimate 1-carboxyvinyltransferase [Rhodospirillales bacterium]|nr:3-phosphoshikimate 1-carboxyvinyltransferase [Rhodospirillales bacterium]MDP6772764.1 3-phosphoshikimate 1-carboxyvinyltransferase [Rhodospirillales bacterium]